MIAKNGTEGLTDLKDCEKYDILKAGKGLAQFLTCVDTVASEIGEYRKSYSIGGSDMIVTGLQLEKVDSPIHMLSDLNTSLEVNGKFINFMDKPAIQVLKAYLNTLDEDKSEFKAAVMNKFKGIANNRNLVLPFKPTDECEVTINDGKTVHKDVQTKITSVMWGMDKATGKFQGKILAKLENIGAASKTYRLILDGYGETFKISSIERSMKISNIDRRTVSMTRFGFVKPVVIKDGNITLALDGTNLYLVTNNVTSIIGTWDSTGGITETAVAKSLNKNKAYKHLKTNLCYIEKHKRFIAPYGLAEASEIQL